jgi:AcrR family transcriptional regulator
MGRNKTIADIELLAVARQVFREQGHAASTRDIARAANISQAVLYQRFGSKDELFFRAMIPEAPDPDHFCGPYPPKDAFEDLLAIAERLAEYLRGFMPILLKVLAVPGVGMERLQDWHNQLPFLPIADALTERFRKLNADGLTGGDNPRAYAISLMSMVHSLAFFELLTTHQVRGHHQANVRGMMQVLWQGIGPRQPAPATKLPAR